MNARRRVAGVAISLILGLGASAAVAQTETYPTRAIRLVVGFAPGGSNDILARVLAEKLQQRVGQPVVVENKPGGGGMTAAAYVASQPADGYNLLVGASGAMVIAPVVYKSMPYDTLRDFTPVSLMATFPLVMITSAKNNHTSVGEFVTWSKANASTSNYATSSPTFTLSTELLKLKTQAKMEAITYRGSNESVVAVLAGNASVAIVDMLPAMPLLQSKELRALATTSASRLPELPDVPTMAEAGVTDMNILIWTGLFARAGTSAPIIARLEQEVRTIMQEPDVKQRLKTLVTDAVGSSSADFRSMIERERQMWGSVAAEAKIKAE